MEWFGNAQANIKNYVEEHLSGFASFNSEQVQEMAEDYYQWLNEMGREFDVERNKYFTCTTSYQHEVKQCYYNSLRYSWEDPDAQYYEGWVVSSRLGLPIRHAWIVSDGEVFDPTFEVLRKEMGYDDNMDYAYWGVEIPSVFISERIVATGLSGPYLFDYFFYNSPYFDGTDANRFSGVMESFLTDDFAYEYQPSQTLSDYSPKQLMESSAIEGYQPLKYSVMRQIAETYAAESDEKKEEARLKKYTKTYGEKGAKIRNRIFKRILKNKQDGTKAGQWSARKAQSLTEDYEKAMNKKGLKAYKSGKKTKSQKSLKRWGDQDWKTKSGKKSSKTGERYLPAKAIEALTDKEYKKTSAKKKRDTKKGKQFSDQPKEIAKKVKKYRAESTKPYSVEISRSTNDEKKLMAVFSDEEGNKIKTTHFGQRGASDYTKHGEKERMERYLERHGGGTTTSTKEDWKDPTTAGSLSRWILWNKPDLKASFNDYKRRFNLKGELKVKRS